MTPRRIALVAGTVVLLGTAFTLAFTNPQFFFPAGSTPSAGARIAATAEETEKTPLRELEPAEVKGMLDRGDPLILADVRGPSSFEARHITGARSMPASEIEAWGPKLKNEDLAVFYCSCPDDHSSSATARQVVENYGFKNVAVLKGGLRAWETAGLPMTLEPVP